MGVEFIPEFKATELKDEGEEGVEVMDVDEVLDDLDLKNDILRDVVLAGGGECRLRPSCLLGALRERMMGGA